MRLQASEDNKPDVIITEVGGTVGDIAFFMVSTAMGTSPWPVMKTMGKGERASILCGSGPCVGAPSWARAPLPPTIPWGRAMPAM